MKRRFNVNFFSNIFLNNLNWFRPARCNLNGLLFRDIARAHIHIKWDTEREKRKINNYYKLLTSNYTRDRSSFKSLSLLWSLRCSACVCEWVSHNGVQCTGACVNILPEWFDRGVWKIEYTLSIVGPIVSVLIFHSLFFFLPHSIKWRWWNRNRIWVIENSKSWEWTRNLKILDTAPNFVIPFFLVHSCFSNWFK